MQLIKTYACLLDINRQVSEQRYVAWLNSVKSIYNNKTRAKALKFNF